MTPELSEGLMPYAEWLESFIRSIVEMKPVRIGVCAVGENGEVLTGYYGDLYPEDKAVMAYHIQTDAIMDTVTANAKQIVMAAEENDDDEAEDG